MITHVEKDQILSFICEHCSMSRISNIPNNLFPIKAPDDIIGILRQFAQKGLISNFNPGMDNAMHFLLNIDAKDYLLHGGFTAQEELIQKNFEKLLLEIESLKPTMPSKVETLTSIISGLSTALGLFIK